MRCHLDHYSVIIETNPRREIHLNRPFKFQSFWLLDPSFPNVVNKVWKYSRKLLENIEKFAKEASLWNKNQFENIFAKTKIIMA